MFKYVSYVCLLIFIFAYAAESLLMRVTLKRITEVSDFLQDINYENFTSFIFTTRKLIQVIPDYLKEMKEDRLDFSFDLDQYCKSKALLSFRNFQLDYMQLEQVCKSYTVYRQTYDALSTVIAFMNVTFKESAEHCKRLIADNSEYNVKTRKSLDNICEVIRKLLNSPQPSAEDLLLSVNYLGRKVDNILDTMQTNKLVNVTYLFESQCDTLVRLNDLGSIKELFNLDLPDLQHYAAEVKIITTTWLTIYSLFNETIYSRKRYYS